MIRMIFFLFFHLGFLIYTIQSMYHYLDIDFLSYVLTSNIDSSCSNIKFINCKCSHTKFLYYKLINTYHPSYFLYPQLLLKQKEYIVLFIRT